LLCHVALPLRSLRGTFSTRVFHWAGPSGPNNQYLFRLAEAIRRIAPESENEDLHLFGLEKLVMEHQRTNGLLSGS
jgi:cation transport regulator ChaC